MGDLVELPSGEPSTTDFITPYISETPEEFNVQKDVGTSDDISLDSYPVLVWEGDIEVGKIFSLVLNLPNILDKLHTEGAENSITQKFMRFANLIPTQGGGFGPVMGSYTIQQRLPTSIAGEIWHNCIPGDMNDEAAIRIFGLSHLASLAGSAMSSVGGPLMNGIINTATPIISGAAHAIGGAPLGGLADLALGASKGVVNTIFPTTHQQDNPSAKPNSISGDIPVSRFVNYVRYVKDNYKNDEVFPTLLIEPRNFFGSDGKAIPKVHFGIYLNMKSVKAERSLFERSVHPQVTPSTNDLTFSADRIPYILECFVHNRESWCHDTPQNVHFRNLLIHLYTTDFGRDFSVSLDQLSRNSTGSYATFTVHNLIELNKFYRYTKAYMDTYNLVDGAD